MCDGYDSTTWQGTEDLRGDQTTQPLGISPHDVFDLAIRRPGFEVAQNSTSDFEYLPGHVTRLI